MTERCQVCAELLEFLEAMAQASHTPQTSALLAIEALSQARREGQTAAFRSAAAELRQLQKQIQPE